MVKKSPRVLVPLSDRLRQHAPLLPILIAGLVVVALLFLFVFPTRTYIAKRHEKTQAQHQLNVLREQNKKLEAQVKGLQTSSQIELIARERFNLVRPGQNAYAILPGPQAQPGQVTSTTATTTTTTRP